MRLLAPRARLRAFLLLATLVGACVPSSTRTPADGALARGSPALALELGLGRIAERARVLWPGFDPLAIPLAVYDGERTYLFRHPDPPDAFVPVRGVSTAAFVYPGRYEAMTANSSAEMGRHPTATVLLDRGVSTRPLAALVGLVVHEAFHVYQRARHPRWAANEADLFVYPTDVPGALAQRRLETEALRRALAARRPANAACWARQALALRRERFEALDSAAVAYERGTELNEGLAAFVEARASGRTTVDLPPSEFGPAEVRRRAYATGAALAFLLDRVAPAWRASFEADDGPSLDGALERSLGPGASCAFAASDVEAAGRQAAADVAALAVTRAARVAAFESRLGWQVVVEAAGQPLWPQGFDPLNVERVGPGRVLHARFLRLGNGAGSVEALDTAAADTEVLTEGPGPHPLFNGVERVVLTGLPEPEVRDDAGRVSVSAPGLTAAFRGASVVRSDERIVVRLAP